jgi:hypothetical protein
MYKSISIIIEQMGHLYHFSWGVVPRWPASYGRLSKRHGLRFSRWRFSTYPLVNVYTLCELEHDDLESSLVLTHFSEGVFPSFFVKGFSIEAKPPFSHSFPTVFLWFFHSNLSFPEDSFSPSPVPTARPTVLIHRSDRRSRCVSSGGEPMSENAWEVLLLIGISWDFIGTYEWGTK